MIAWFFNLFRRNPEKAQGYPEVRSGRVSAAKPNPSKRPSESSREQAAIRNLVLPNYDHDHTQCSCENETRFAPTRSHSHTGSQHRNSCGESSHYSGAGGDSGDGGGGD